MALGFGPVSTGATLGQPLSFAIGLRVDASDSVDGKCAKAEVSLGERLLPDALIITRLETAPATGERRVRVTTRVPVNEPVVTVNLHIGCPAVLSRSFLVFADPPARAAIAGNDAASAPWVTDGVDSPVAGVLAAASPTVAPTVATRAQDRAVARKRREAGADLPSRAQVAASTSNSAPAPVAARRAREPKASAKPSRGPVLRLDPVEADALFSPSLQLARSLSEMPGSGASGVVPRFVDPDQEQRLRELERLKAMESVLLKLRSDSEATHKTLTDMQVRVRAAEASRYANPLVYLLALLCIVLVAALVAMWWLRRRDRRAAIWWTPPQDATPVPAPASDELAVPEPPPLPSPIVRVPEPASRHSDFAPVSAPQPMSAVARDSQSGGIVEPRRPMSAEELIDLEQQAEFFVVLGQDDAAIDLLMGHVRSTGGVSPLPYLKLLEIYRRQGEREPYDRIRERFNRRFNAYAPEWDVDPEMGLALDGYPEVLSRVQRAWATPSQAMELLDASLFRRDAGPTFDVPAYRELLFLYGLARDLAERDVAPEGVDLLLPLSDEEMEPMLTSVSASQAPSPPAEDIEHFTIDLDVSTDQSPHLTLEDPDFKRNSR